MSEAIFYSPGASARGPDVRRTGIRRNLGSSRILKLALVLCLLGIMGDLLFSFIIKPAFPLTRVNLNTSLGLPQSKILDIAGISGKEYYFSLDVRAITARLEAIPAVSKAVVSRRFPDTLDIVLTPRSPRALVLAADGAATVPFLVDGDGLVYAADGVEANVPVISGIDAGFLADGKRLPKDYRDVINHLSGIAASSPGLLDMFSEFRIDRTDYGTVELTVFPLNSNLRIRTDDELSASLLRYCLLSADILEKQGLTKTVNEIDFRTGTVVYRDTQQGGAL